MSDKRAENKRREASGRAALAMFEIIRSDAEQESFVDTLADICHAKGDAWVEDCLRIAKMHYQAERE